MGSLSDHDLVCKGATSPAEGGDVAPQQFCPRARLAQLLAVPGCTVQAVADEAEMSRPYVSLMLTGRREVTSGVLEAAERVARQAVGEQLADLGRRVATGGNRDA